MEQKEQTEQITRAIKKGLINWYDFEPGAAALYIGKETDALAEALAEKKLQVVCASIEQVSDEGSRYDYLICVEALEREAEPLQALKVFKSLLKPTGKLLLGMNNRYGLRYFCGDRDPYTERNFDGVEDYRRAYAKKEDIFQGRCYSQAEMKAMLQSAGIAHFRFYSVLSDLQNPSLLYGEDFLPNEDLINRVFPTYHYPNTVFLEEESIYRGLTDNGMFHAMANAYFIECPLGGNCSDVVHVTSSMSRGREDALFTIIHKSGVVEKRAAYPEGQRRLEKLMEHGKDLAAHRIPVVDATLRNGSYRMPYMEGETGQLYLKRLLHEDREKFLQAMDHFRDLIMQSSDIIEEDKGDGLGATLKRGYFDMVPLNSFYQNGTFVFYDQEFCEENYPANVLIWRMIASFYVKDVSAQKLLPRDVLLERYGLTANLSQWQEMEQEFLARLLRYKELGPYYGQCRRNDNTVNANRQRMNYSTEEYQKLFVDIFRNADTRKLILFGSGNFARRFLALYSQDYPVHAIIDNNEEKWGQELEGIPIRSPQLLQELQSGEYKVLICMKNYVSVMKQLNEMGVVEYSIFELTKDYPRKRKPIVQTSGESTDAVPKKYHTGYLAGVFDLFHVGHLNMFKRAKELCEYLIVGIVSDEGVRKYKGTEPFVPFEERIEMVRSCRYVDEAVEIPLEYRGTQDAFRLYHFDCQFSGSDHADDPDWLGAKKFLNKHGADLVFFPYTEQTSSTKIKELIEQKLL